MATAISLVAAAAAVITRPVIAAAAPQVAGANPGAQEPGRPLSREEINERFVQRVLASIAGRGEEPASRVFKNLQIDWLKDVPANQFVDIMNGGYSRALGVTCTHCHVEADFSSDDKRPKRAAREMAVMHHGINQQLARIERIDSPVSDRLINCATCHRGSVNPHDAAR